MRPFYGKLQLIRAYNPMHAEVKLMMDKIDKGRYQSQTFLDAILYNELGERKQKVIFLSEESFIVSIHFQYISIARSWTRNIVKFSLNSRATMS